MSRRAPLTLVATIALSGCAGAEDRSRTPAEELVRGAPAIARALAAPGPRASCRGQAPAVSGAHALVVTARQCLGCLEVGYAARHGARRAQDAGGMVVVAARRDSAPVCRAMRKEKVGAPVLLLPDSLVPWHARPADLLHLTVEPDGSASNVRTAADGVSLLDVLEGRAGPPPPSDGELP